MAKRTFFQLYKQYHIGKWELAQEAKVELEVINSMLTNEPVARSDALKVLHIVSRWAGIRYSLEDVDVKVGGD
jgi:hypothetical protein